MSAPMIHSMHCEHGRLADSCEDCALVRALERGYRPNAVPTTPTPQPEITEHPVFIDHGDGHRFTFVAAGGEVPRGLSHLPRSPIAAPAREHDRPLVARMKTTSRKPAAASADES